MRNDITKRDSNDYMVNQKEAVCKTRTSRWGEQLVLASETWPLVTAGALVRRGLGIQNGAFSARCALARRGGGQEGFSR
jgi:hypothetical protein